jgi:2-methylisocitrate lyase-like PEP mutase family enzyme
VSAQAEKAAAFQALHSGEPFVIPNPWDAGSARVLETLGFKALATTSSGFAFTLGRLDGNVTLDEVMEHVRLLVAASDLPISVEIRAACEAVSKPVNVLARRNLSMAEIVNAGAQRISVGGALTWTAVNAVAAATEIRDHGDFSSLGDSSRLEEWLAR